MTAKPIARALPARSLLARFWPMRVAAQRPAPRIDSPRLHDPRLDGLWRQVVAIARAPAWYRKGGITDTRAGRFDALTLVLALVLLRVEAEPTLGAVALRLTERFIADIDGQLRESGMGDPRIGREMGRLASVLGGRLEAYRAALAEDAADRIPDSPIPDPLVAVIARNIALSGDAAPEPVAAMARALHVALAKLDTAALLAGAFPLPEVLA